jgi:hypothetical protein
VASARARRCPSGAHPLRNASTVRVFAQLVHSTTVAVGSGRAVLAVFTRRDTLAAGMHCVRAVWAQSVFRKASRRRQIRRCVFSSGSRRLHSG